MDNAEKSANANAMPNNEPRKASPLFRGLMDTALMGACMFAATTVLHRLEYSKGTFTWNAMHEDAKAIRSLATAMGAGVAGGSGYHSQKLENRLAEKNERLTHLERVLAEKDALMNAAQAKG